MRNWLKTNKYKIWYALCFCVLGLVDQRRGSASGNVQMTFVNLTGPVLALMMLPSMKKEFFHWKGFKIWVGVSVILTPAACLIGRNYWPYFGQWCTAMLNIAVIACLFLYLAWDWKELRTQRHLNRVLFGAVMLLLFLMGVSVHGSIWPFWFLALFGSFYLIGIPENLEEQFFTGMFVGIILWFFVQQTVAFGFRPYDFVRYRGLYSGETQNGLFYMTAFCGFLCRFMQLKERKAALWRRCLCFLLAAGCVSFIFLTGGRASLTGAVAAGCLGLAAYDVLLQKSFRHWLVQGIALGACVILLLPAVYGSVRYLPVVLHHPIWFEGEYKEDSSVHSYDPWNSERYVTFEQVIDHNVGRILEMLGIHLDLDGGKLQVATPLSLRAQAAERTEPGSSPENPFMLEGTDTKSSISIRKTIYAYYLKHLNFRGHTPEEAGFYMTERLFYGHAHNMFLQIAYDYGILPGILFLLCNLWFLVRFLRRKDRQGISCAVFLIGILLYGFTEMAVVTGQITLTLLFLLYYFGLQKRRIR